MEQIDYKEKYEQALAKVKELAIDGYLDAVAVDDIFPEFKEPYDERIRKRIIQALLGDVLDIEETNEAIDWLKKQGEQKPVEWAKEDIQMYRNILFYLSEPSPLKEVNGKSREQLLDWLKSLKNRVQPKQEWSGGDEAHLHSLITHLEQWMERHPNTTGADIQGENIAWLKSLKDRIRPKVELTQLDKNILEAAIAFVEQNNHFNCWRGVDKHTVLSALHSLRPQNMWKPSDEQINALSVAVKHG